MATTPSAIQFTNANVTKYVYSATGEKLRVIYQTSVYPEDADIVKIGKTKELTPEEINCTETVDYLLGGSLVMKNGKIDKILFDGGYAQASAVSNTTKDKFAFYYYNQDHLGNNREVVDAKGVVQQVTNYYSFGAPYADTTAIKGAAVQPYKYNGKELDLMHGLNTYDYGARQYNPVTGRWDKIDPLCEKYYSTSPYAYCANNPVKFIDPDGKQFLTPSPMLGVTDMLTFGRSDVMTVDGGKYVEVARVAKAPQGKQVHHWIPRQFKKHPIVEKAIKGGYKFEGKENKSPLSTFSKSTGKGQHANHPKYSTQIKDKLNKVDKGLSPEQTANEVRQIKNAAKKAVRSNPTKKLNDIKM